MNQKKILIYSPNIGGHRQVYCNVIAHWALESNMSVVFYIGNNWCEEKNTESQISPYFEVFNNENVEFYNTLFQDSSCKSNSDHLICLENEVNPDIVFVVSGDEFNHSLYSFIINLFPPKKHSSKWVGIFISCYCYPKSANFFKKFAQKISLYQKVRYFDSTYWLDEYFIKKSNTKNKLWLPDISKSFNLTIGENELTEYKLFSPRIDDFLEKNKGKEILLFFGRDFNRKGFDFIVQLALDDEQFIVIRAGDSLENMDDNLELFEKMGKLEADGRLLNIAKFIEDMNLIEKLFSITNFIPLPYRNHYSSSGVMLQAMEYNKPVIVPNIGLMEKRVIENNVGITYNHKDYNDFKKAVYKMQSEYLGYTLNIAKFQEAFSKEQIFMSLDKMKLEH